MSAAKKTDVIFETESGLIKEVLDVIKREELLTVNKTSRAREIWLDVNTGEIEVLPAQNHVTYDAGGYSDGENGKILLWTRVENRPISEIISMLTKRKDAPFFGKSFVEWYLRENFSDRIFWQI